jgi:hypothetical protein
MVKKVTILMIILMALMIPLAYVSSSTTSIYVLNINEDEGYYFIYDTMYEVGEDIEPETNYVVTLVKNLNLTNHMVMPESAPDTPMTITSDSSGGIALREIWNQWNNTESSYLTIGDFYVIVDIDDDGVYNEEVDIVAAYARVVSIKYGEYSPPIVESEVPQFITPEFPGGSIMAILAFLLAALFIRSKKIMPILKPA